MVMALLRFVWLLETHRAPATRSPGLDLSAGYGRSSVCFSGMELVDITSLVDAVEQTVGVAQQTEVFLIQAAAGRLRTGARKNLEDGQRRVVRCADRVTEVAEIEQLGAGACGVHREAILGSLVS